MSSSFLKPLLMVLLASADLIECPLALAQPAALARDWLGSARLSMALTQYPATATAASIERVVDVRLSAASRDTDARRAELRQAQGREAIGRAAATRLQALAQAQERNVDELGRQERANPQGTAVLPSDVEDISSTPEGLQARDWFDAGDWVGARAILDALDASRDQARDAGANLQSAADKRWIAALALQAHSSGQETTAAVIARYEIITRLDPGVQGDWAELARLYMAAGRLEDARRAAVQSVETAVDEMARSVARLELGDVLREQGEIAAARAHYEGSLATAQRLAAADPSSTWLQRQLSANLARMGHVLVDEGDLAGGRARYEESLAIYLRLAAADPSSASLQHEIAESRLNLGDVLISQRELPGARANYEEGLAIAQRLVAADPTSTWLQHLLSRGLDSIGYILIYEGYRAGGLARIEEALAITERLAAGDTSSRYLQREVSLSLFNLGEALSLFNVGEAQLWVQPDYAGARARYEQSFAISERLAAAYPGWAVLESDMSLTVNRLNYMLAMQGDRAGARAIEIQFKLFKARRQAALDPSSPDRQREVSEALIDFGNVLMEQEDFAGALIRYEESLAIAQRFAAAHPSSIWLQRDVALSLNGVGDVLAVQGDLAGARTRYDQSLAIARHLATLNPSSSMRRDILISLWNLATIPGSGVTWQMVLTSMERLERRGELVNFDQPWLNVARDRAAGRSLPGPEDWRCNLKTDLERPGPSQLCRPSLY